MLDNTLYPATVPYLDAASYAALEDYDPSQPLPLNWNSFTPDIRTTEPFVNFFVLDLSTFSSVFQTSTTANVSSFMSTTIPASTLTPNHQYQATLVFSNGVLRRTPFSARTIRQR